MLATKRRNRQWITLGVVATCLRGVAPAARAGLILTAQSVSATAGDMNVTFNVYLTEQWSAVDVSSFNFEINTTERLTTRLVRFVPADAEMSCFRIE